MELFAVRTSVINVGENLIDVIFDSLRAEGLQLEDDDIIALTSKIVSYAENRLVRLSEIHPSMEGIRLAHQYSLRPEFAELILREADVIYGGVAKAVLTLKNGVLTANSGIDNKNAPDDHVVLWPIDPEKSARNIRDEVSRRVGKRVAVLIVDSSLSPLRIGTTGQALAVAGFRPIIDRRKSRDLFGKSIMITRHAIADDLASAAHLLMGEATERVPVVLIKKAQVTFDNGVYGSVDMTMPFEQCIFMGTFLPNSYEPTKG